jgi:ribosome-associated heat shock protein Hsp15
MDAVVTLRIDKWLKNARFYKKRADASDAVDSGSVKLNGERVKPSKAIRVGDRLTVKKDSQYKNYTVKGISTKPLGAALAKELYEADQPDETTVKAAEWIKILDEQDRKARREMKGKPDKKQMRELRKRKYGDD